MDNRTRIEDYIADLLFEYHNKAREAKIEEPDVRSRSIAALQQQWALSSGVRDLGMYVLQNRHELQSTVSSRCMQDDAVARGTIDARETVLERSKTGHPTRLVYQEPFRVYDTGPNGVLAYVLSRATELVQRVRRRLPAGSESRYGSRAEQVLDTLQRVRRIGPIAQLLQEARGRRRPTKREVSQARRSRKKVYQRAADIYQYLVDIESGKRESVRALLKDTLVAPLETWRAYELAVAVGIARSLSEREGTGVETHPIASSEDSGILRCGRYRIHWQSQTEYFSSPDLTRWEEKEKQILRRLGAPLGGSCPDLVIEDLDAGEVISVVEVKYYTGTDGWKEALREATSQLVWYLRGYAEEDRVAELLKQSAIAVWKLPEEGPILSARLLEDTLYVTDFGEVQSDLTALTDTFYT